MTEHEGSSEPRNHAPVWGIFLLFLGVVLLLQTLNVLQWSLWGTLWRFWPALLIILGVAIIMRHSSIWLICSITLVVLGVSLGIAIWQNNTDGFGGKNSVQTFTQPLSGLSDARVNIDFTAGNFTIESLPSGSANLVEVNADTKNNVSSMETSFSQQNNTGYLALDSTNQQYWPGGGITWNADFTRDIPLTFDITSAASQTDIDLEHMNLAKLTLELNAGDSSIDFPSPRGVVRATIEANAANVVISLPDDAAVRVQASTSIGSLDVNSRFIKQGNDYVTTNYDGASDRIELEIETNIGRVQVK